jgi:hypothetical protein
VRRPRTAGFPDLVKDNAGLDVKSLMEERRPLLPERPLRETETRYALVLT